jgi:uncharacterized SAM-binding protein YcdF (DUF218 family)
VILSALSASVVLTSTNRFPEFPYIRITMQQVLHYIKKSFRWLFLFLGVFFFILSVLAFTSVPYEINRWLGTSDSDYNFTPDAIVFLGGSGMPSEANLMRIYYTSFLTTQFPKAKVFIVHPKDTSTIADMRVELILHKVDSTHIYIEKRGTNTREQALTLAEDYKELLSQKIVVVTSTENMRRTVKTFRKAGFKQVGGQSSFETAMFADLKFDFKKAGGKMLVPDVSGNMALRYNYWNYLKLEITCLREFVALGYYKLNGWI